MELSQKYVRQHCCYGRGCRQMRAKLFLFFFTAIVCYGCSNGSQTPDEGNNDPCQPSAFNVDCLQDSDADGKTDFTETETADSDLDGTADYLESAVADADSDGVVDELDPANSDACIPDMSSPACGPTGLSIRPANSTCIAPDIDINASSEIQLVREFSSASIDLPVKGLLAPGDNEHWFIAEKSGAIIRLSRNNPAATEETYLTTLADDFGFSDERGLLSFAFSPDWPARKEIYVSYTFENSGTKSRLSRLVITDDSSLPATYSEQVLFELDQLLDNHIQES